MQRRDPSAGLAYFDGDADLSTPRRSRSGILDSMGVAHLPGLADTELARLDGRSPILDDAHLALLGYDETDPDAYDAGILRARPLLQHFPDRDLRSEPEAVAARAVAALSQVAGSLVVPLAANWSAMWTP